MDSWRIHISQREVFSSDGAWLSFLEANNDKFDCLILREESLDIELASLLSKRLKQPVILNTGIVFKASSIESFNLDEVFKSAKGIHLKGEEVTRLIKMGKAGGAFLEAAKARYRLTIGTSVHSVKQVELAINLGSFDYFLISPIRVTGCKPNALALLESERQQILQASQRCEMPPKCIALGGMNYRELSLAKQWGFDGVAGRNQFLISE